MFTLQEARKIAGLPPMVDQLNEIITDGPPEKGEKSFKVTYTTNRGRDSNTRSIQAVTRKDAVKFVLKTLGTPVKIDGKDIDLGKLDDLD